MPYRTIRDHHAKCSAGMHPQSVACEITVKPTHYGGKNGRPQYFARASQRSHKAAAPQMAQNEAFGALFSLPYLIH